MWDYCVYLGPFTDSNGKNYDLGIHVASQCAAIVYGNQEGNYISGELNKVITSDYISEHYSETFKRAKALNLIQ